jgi:hypothetical protein
MLCGISSRRGSDSRLVVARIIAQLRVRYSALNTHYEAAWTHSWIHQRCGHAHRTLIDAAKCAMPQGAGWYVVAVEFDKPRELNEAEERAVNQFRFGRSVTPEC